MRRMTTVIVLLIAFVMLPAFAQEKTALSKAEEEVRKLEREWLDAYEKNDAEAMDRIVGENFQITFPDGSRQTKPQLMSMIKAGRKGQAPPRFYTEDVQSRAYGDTVVLMGRVIAEFQRDGKTVKDVSRYTDTYVKLNGRWQVVASHLSNAAPPKQ